MLAKRIGSGPRIRFHLISCLLSTFARMPTHAEPGHSTQIVGVGSSTIERMTPWLREGAAELGAQYVDLGDGGAIVQHPAAEMGALPAQLSFQGNSIPSHGAALVGPPITPSYRPVRPHG